MTERFTIPSSLNLVLKQGPILMASVLSVNFELYRISLRILGQAGTVVLKCDRSVLECPVYFSPRAGH